MEKKKNQWVVYERALLNSKAYRELKKPRAHLLIQDFLGKRQLFKQKGKKGREAWEILNNGKIEFTYSEAKLKGYSPRQFSEALTEIVGHGFIDVTESGGIYDGHKSKYAISERWRKYDTDEFESVTRPKDTRKGRGFKAAIKKYGPMVLGVCKQVILTAIIFVNV